MNIKDIEDFGMRFKKKPLTSIISIIVILIISFIAIPYLTSYFQEKGKQDALNNNDIEIQNKDKNGTNVKIDPETETITPNTQQIDIKHIRNPEFYDTSKTLNNGLKTLVSRSVPIKIKPSPIIKRLTIMGLTPPFENSHNFLVRVDGKIQAYSIPCTINITSSSYLHITCFDQHGDSAIYIEKPIGMGRDTLWLKEDNFKERL